MEATAYCTANEYNYSNVIHFGNKISCPGQERKYQLICPIHEEVGEDVVLIRITENETTSDQVTSSKNNHTTSSKNNQVTFSDSDKVSSKGFEEGQVFIFRDLGSVVFWNVSKSEQRRILEQLVPFSSNPVKSEIVLKESESMDYVINLPDTDLKMTGSESGGQSFSGQSRLSKGIIYLKVGDEGTRSDVRSESRSSVRRGASEKRDDTHPNLLDQYSFSNAIALSVKLASYEASLDEFSETIQGLSEEMKEGRKVSVSESGVLQKSGELFTLRHEINLNHQDFLDPPDFYWDRRDLESLFTKTSHVLNIAKRTSLMNDKLTYCYELLQLLQTHLSDKHSSKLEWYIITLISVEIIFSLPHLLIALGFLQG